ncbi:formylglycine-generating enzyme required for sulfatase activity [Rhodobium gokarnense]|uniref:Formylglycine-generating enzyme required for sulfatase activity n=1 Tax=Rhodobium gokarnense TaxID=364296 RepID=A0ABT3HEQ7_9HYPH|nr:formylglycine-generating enzyme required for sulfatase activity [Rhodobium gokarnense]
MSCCGAGKAGQAENAQEDSNYLVDARSVAPAPADVQAALKSRLTDIPGRIFEMAARKSIFPEDYDNPRRRVRLSLFLMSPFALTNRDYADVVDATGYRTVAEKEGWSYVFHLRLADASAWPQHPEGLPW